MTINGQSFKSKEEALKYLKENKSELKELKKAATKFGDSIGFKSAPQSKNNATKALSEDGSSLKVTVVGNTYNWMDSHDDVHVKGCFTKTIKEKGNRIWHLHDHEYKLTSKVGRTQNVYEKELAWKDLGVDKSGTTTALLMDSELDKSLNTKIFNMYKNGEIDQHSVGMQYVKIDLAMNDEEEEEEYKNWKDNIDKLANPERAEEQGFFWVVREAKLIEVSAVLEGSNSITPTLEDKSEPSQDTQKSEPESTTQLDDFESLFV